MSLSTKTITGVLWNFGEQLLRRGVQAFTTILLAFFLAPEAYGLVAMMAVFIAIATSVMDSGFKQALIRLSNATQKDLSTAFWTNLGLGGLAYVVLFVSAPLIADFYKEPQLVLLIRIASIVVLISAFKIVQEAVFSRELNFKIQLKANLPAALVSSVVAIVLAYWDYGVWALVAQMHIFALISVLSFWYYSRWRPSFLFNKQSFLKMYDFGYKLLLSGLLDIVFRNVYVIVIAKTLSSGITGLYYFATQIVSIIDTQLVSAISNVTYPALSKIQSDEKKLKEGYRRIIILVTFIVFPTFTCLAALAGPLFHAFLPERWWQAVPYLQWLCIGGMFYPLHSINLNVLKVKGRSDLFLYLEIVKKALVVFVLLISFRYGIYGILIGQAIVTTLAYIPNSYFTAKLISYPITEQVKDFLPNLILSLLVAGGVYSLTLVLLWSEWLMLLVLLPLGVVAYFLLAYVFKMQALTLCLNLVRQQVLKNR
ncbi:lipopolysaccharide biosynthesis protein [Acinetobacter indicus]|uniref:Lipopolysaccharide biosynthesis protein n=1 Tax=Acinetobacter indicus TaxID=756892 RepID=A0A6C0Y5J4_9GAMM|nr:lipopolysaccharide biosynthesis protein [Acinetobacter indicus]QIC71521.1 lipopolysaccharide biosynthesis protein [Acinetobacter indicus]